MEKQTLINKLKPFTGNKRTLDTSSLWLTEIRHENGYLYASNREISIRAKGEPETETIPIGKRTKPLSSFYENIEGEFLGTITKKQLLDAVAISKASGEWEDDDPFRLNLIEINAIYFDPKYIKKISTLGNLFQVYTCATFPLINNALFLKVGVFEVLLLRRITDHIEKVEIDNKITITK